jgi:FkbM family methyltransferase
MLVTHNKLGGRSYSVPDTDKYFQEILSKGPYQYQNLQRLLTLQPNPRHIVDVGVNLGQNIIEYAQHAKKVTGFEPTPDNYNHAQTTIQLNKQLYKNTQIDFYQQALSNNMGTMKLATHKSNVGTNYLINNPTKNRDNWVDVAVTTLDSHNLEDVDIIKIDVEGYELYVLQGAEQTITKYRPIIQTEIRDSHCQRAGYTTQELQDWFNAHNYTRTLKNGTVVPGSIYQKLNKGDSFWVPNERVVK